MTSWLKNKAHKKGEQKHLFMHFSTLPCPSLLAVGYLLIGRLLVQSPAAPVSIPTILEQDAKLLSDRQVCFVWLQREIRVISIYLQPIQSFIPTKSSLWMFVFVCGSNFTRLTHFLVWKMLEVEKWESCYYTEACEWFCIYPWVKKPETPPPLNSGSVQWLKIKEVVYYNNTLCVIVNNPFNK